jgi:hypothetical protein
MWPLSLAAAVYVPLLDGLVYFSGPTELHRITEKQAVTLLKEFHHRMQRKGKAHVIELLCEQFFLLGGRLLEDSGCLHWSRRGDVRCAVWNNKALQLLSATLSLLCFNPIHLDSQRIV